MTGRSASFLAGLVLAGTLGALAIADPAPPLPGLDPGMPDPTLTPGVVASTDVKEVCATDGLPGSSYSRQHRLTTREMKRQVLHAYGLSGFFHGEIDHRVPLCLGGADDVKNLWPQTEYRAKDELEAYACREVCAGRLRLSEAQSWFLGDNPQLGAQR